VADTPKLVTTSWDDGDPLDLRLAERLAAHGLVGTFYVPIERGGAPVLGTRDMLELVDMGMEIGAHTYSHVMATTISVAELRRELTESKDILEQQLGHSIRSFCYPNGRYSKSLRPVVDEAGYDVARTTASFLLDTKFDPLFMPVTCQIYPHSRKEFLTHALRTHNARGAITWLSTLHGEHRIIELTKLAARHVERAGGVVHIWGHSWELETAGLWNALDDVMQMLQSFSELVPVTNAGVLDAVEKAR